jgi:predicted transcriptional regulator
MLPQLWHIATIREIFRWEESNMATTSIRLDQELVDKATIMARALNRTPPKQIEHWAKIGEIMEDNPDLPYEFVRQAIIAAAEREAGKLESYDFG